MTGYRAAILGCLGLLVLCALVAGAVGSAAASDRTELDADTPLTDNSTIETYQETETTTADVQQLDMTITISDDRREAGVDRLTGGTAKTYLRVQYNESIDRTVRFYVPSEYFHPRVDTGDSAVQSDHEIMLEPVTGGNYTAVTVDLDGETDATWSINDLFGRYLSERERMSDFSEDLIGYRVPLPGASGVDQWHHVPGRTLSENGTTYTIPAPPEDQYEDWDPSAMTVQYDMEPESPDGDWRAIHACQQQFEPVCIVDDGSGSGDDANASMVLLATSDDPPPIRYKYDRDRFAETGSATDEWLDGMRDFVDDITGIFGAITPASTVDMAPSSSMEVTG